MIGAVLRALSGQVSAVKTAVVVNAAPDTFSFRVLHLIKKIKLVSLMVRHKIDARDSRETLRCVQHHMHNIQIVGEQQVSDKVYNIYIYN